MSADSNDRKLTVLGWILHLGGLVTILCGACAYHFSISGLITHQQSENAEEIARLESLIEVHRDVGTEFASLQEKLARLEASAEAARLRIPETAQESEFLARISEAAREEKLTIQNFTRGDVTVLGTHSQLQIRLTGEGKYASICGFFEKIATFSRVATVSRMDITVPTNSDIFPLDMTLMLYFGAKAPEGSHHG